MSPGHCGWTLPSPTGRRVEGDLTLDATRICPMVFRGGPTPPPPWPPRDPLRGVNMVSRALSQRLRWSEVPITFGH